MFNCGIDVVEVSRIKSAAEKNSGFLEKVFSPKEIEYFVKKNNAFESLAGFFAAKEAFAKCIGTGISGFRLTDVSIEHLPSGEPYITFKGEKQPLTLSITHEKSVAIAVVCGDCGSIIKIPCKDEMKRLVPARPQDSNKGDFGRVLVLAGSRGMTGAAVLSGFSALRSGAGLVTIATAESERKIVAGFYPEIITQGLPSQNGKICAAATKDILKLIQNQTAIVFGPGIGQSEDILLILKEILTNYTGKLIIDADGLNVISKDIRILSDRKCEVIITPHPGEMSRLVKLTTSDVQQNREHLAREFAKKHGVTIALKGYKTVVADDKGNIFVNPTGNPGMAKAGSGDVLAGMIGAFCSQDMNCFDAAMLGAYTHGLAGDIAKDKVGVHGMVATDVIDEIPKAILKIIN
jgi:NAD(P)H-hydrate epimerase